MAPVEAEVARALGAELDLIVVRNLGLPFQPAVARSSAGRFEKHLTVQ